MSNPFGSAHRLLSRRERFEMKYIPEPNSGCWLWMGGCNPNGYGSITTNRRSDSAHRVAWQLYIGPIPPAMCVLHRCDVKRCVNPHHLFLGTHKDNVADCAQKGRRHDQRGDRNNGAKLTVERVRYLRSLASCSMATLKQLAEEWRMSWIYLWYVRKGRTWQSVEN